MPRARETAADVERRLDAGEPLSPGQIALLVGVSRYAVDHWLNKGIRTPGSNERWYPEWQETPGGHRKVVPADVRRLVAMHRTRRRGPRTEAPPAE